MPASAPSISSRGQAQRRKPAARGPKIRKAEDFSWRHRKRPRGSWFDRAAAETAVWWIETYCVFTEGSLMGRPFKLAPWQRALVQDVWGWKNPDGTRLYREVYVAIPRRNGKTTLAAALALLLLVGDGENAPQVYSLAVDRDQAKICLEAAKRMVELSEPLQNCLEVLSTAIFCPRLMGGFKIFSNQAASKNGYAPHGLVADEVHAWPSGETLEVAHKGTGSRDQPLEIIITTAGIHEVGFGWEKHQEAVAVLRGDEEDPELYVVIFGADEEVDDWQDEKVWKRCNPGMPVSPTLRFMRREAKAALRSPRKENAFKRYHLNIWVPQTVRWLPARAWDKCTAQPGNKALWQDLQRLERRIAFGGLDLASVSDLTALSWYLPPEDAGDRGVLLWRFWAPEARLDDLSDAQHKRYDAWVASGALRLTPGNVTDYDFVRAEIESDAERLDVRGLAIDRWNATQVSIQLANEGLPVELFGQGYAMMGAPTKELERQVLGETFLEHGNNPLARWCALNSVVRMDPAGNIKPDKSQAGGKIDGTVAAVMALGLYMADRDETIDYKEGDMAA